MRSYRLLLAALTLTFLVACSAGATPGALEQGDSPSPTPPPALTLWPSPTPDLGAKAEDLRGVRLRVWHAFAGDTAAAFEKAIALFNTVNEWGITMYVERQPEYRALYEALQNAARDEQPNLVVALPEQILLLADEGRLVALNPYLTDRRWGLTEEAIRDIPPAFWQQDEADGQRWAIPLARSARFLFYNQTWARELGFNRPPANADEFRQQACAANATLRADADARNDGYGGWLVDTHWQTAYNWLLAFGGRVLENDAYRFDSAENRAALTFLKELYDDHCAWLPLEIQPAEAFARRLALFVNGDLREIATFETTLARANNADEWTLLPYPGPQRTAISAYGASIAALRSTPAQNLAAWLFLRWWLSPATQASWARESGFLPLRVSALASLGSYRAAHPAWESASALAVDMEITPPLASWRIARYVLEDGVTHLFRLNLPPEQIPAVLQEMQRTVQELTGGE